MTKLTKSLAITKPKILVLDIETGPGKGYVWSLYDTFMPLERLIEPGRMLCFDAKWYGQKEHFFSAEWIHGRERMLYKLRDLLNEADAVVTFNGDKFDLAKVNGEFVVHRIPPAAPVTSIDLYKTIKKLGFQSGKLEFVGPYLKIGAKLKHAGFSLWRIIMEGANGSTTSEHEAKVFKARAKMELYNKQDVNLTARLYTVLRPYITNHPYLGKAAGHSCSVCGSTHLQSRGSRRTRSFLVQRLECQACGHWDQGTRTKVKK